MHYAKDVIVTENWRNSIFQFQALTTFVQNLIIFNIGLKMTFCRGTLFYLHAFDQCAVCEFVFYK
jgi:hypothetical protein